MKCTRLLPAFSLGLLVGVVGCADYSPAVSHTISMSFALTETDSPLLESTVKSFRVRLYRSAPESWQDAPYYYSDCASAVPVFGITKVPVGSHRAVVYEGYDDEACESSHLVALGLRGDITVSETGYGDAVYYIPLYLKDGFSPFPLPPKDLDPSLGGERLKCEVDDDCREVVDCLPEENCLNGQKWVFHPRAVCDGGVCRVPDLFPLNTKGQRAYQQALALPWGKVLIFGGLSVLEGDTLVASDPLELGFDGGTSLFSEEGIAGFGNPSAMAATVSLDDKTLVVAGGISRMRLNGLHSVIREGFAECQDLSKCPLVLSSILYVVHASESGVFEATEYVLPVATAGGQVEVLPDGKGGKMLLVRAGLAYQEGKLVFSSLAYLLKVGNGYRLECAEPAEGEDPGDQVLDCKPAEAQLPARGLTTGMCLSRSSDGSCERFLIAGGNHPEDKQVGELYADGEVSILTAAGDMPRSIFGPAALVVEGGPYLIGGLQPGNKWNGVMRLEVEGTDLRGQRLQAQEGDVGTLYRQFATATLLSSSGKVLFAGGLDSSQVPLETYALMSFKAKDGFVVETSSTIAGKRVDFTMNEPRVGHTAVVLKGGVLAGSVLFVGGLYQDPVDKVMRFCRGAELFLQ